MNRCMPQVLIIVFAEEGKAIRENATKYVFESRVSHTHESSSTILELLNV